MTAYCLDPAFWNDDHYTIPGVLEAFRIVMVMVFYFPCPFVLPIVSVNFINCCEDWEAESVTTKNKGHEDGLVDKYRHLYFYVHNAFEIRLIIQIEVTSGRRCCLTHLLKT